VRDGRARPPADPGRGGRDHGDRRRRQPRRRPALRAHRPAGRRGNARPGDEEPGRRRHLGTGSAGFPVIGSYDRPGQEYVLSDLDTGERLITERVGSVRSVSLGFWIGAGSRDETDARAGVTHFIEHLLFKGTRSYSAVEIAEIFDELGGELNAATSRESTVV